MVNTPIIGYRSRPGDRRSGVSPRYADVQVQNYPNNAARRRVYYPVNGYIIANNPPRPRKRGLKEKEIYLRSSVPQAFTPQYYP